MDTDERRYRGVTRHKRDRYWRVRLKKHGEYFYLKHCQTLRSAETAARVYDVAADYLHGPDAILNFDGSPPAGIAKAEIFGWLLKTIQERGWGPEHLYGIMGTLTKENEDEISQETDCG